MSGISDFLKSINSGKERDEEKLKRQIENNYDKIKNINENDLMAKLFNEVAKQKQNGNFDYEKLNSAIDKMSSVLPEEHIKKLRQLLEQFK